LMQRGALPSAPNWRSHRFGSAIVARGIARKGILER
jgi:hypothetical protein